VRDALREHLRRLTIRDLEERDRAGYSKQPQTPDDASWWEAESQKLEGTPSAAICLM